MKYCKLCVLRTARVKNVPRLIPHWEDVSMGSVEPIILFNVSHHKKNIIITGKSPAGLATKIDHRYSQDFLPGTGVIFLLGKHG
jgi:hypothetical protein